MTCDSCRFWEFLRYTEPGVEIGECRRHAPVPLADVAESTPRLRATWRLTMFDDWCGEFVQKQDRAKPNAEFAVMEKHG